VAKLRHLALAIQALTADYAEKSPQELARRVGWEKTPAVTYKVNNDASLFEGATGPMVL
jgi:hypothetical protein